MKALEHYRPRSAEIIPIDRPMGKPRRKQQPPKPAPAPAPTPAKLDRWVAIAIVVTGVAGVVGLLISLGTLYYTMHRDSVTTQSASSDDHTNRLIDEKLDPVKRDIQELTGKVNQALGELDKINLKLKVSSLRQGSPGLLAQSNNSSDVLTGIRASLENAQKGKHRLPETEVVEYRKKIQSLSPSTTDYWTTVADIINYQSFLNQLENRAPDPSTIAHPCAFVTAGTGNFNVIQGPMVFEACLVDLDTTTNVVDGAFIKNSVVRYHGGAVTMRNVTFVNCRFILDIRKSQTPTHPELLQQLLASNQLQVRLSTAG
jgi:hypothetical protein